MPANIPEKTPPKKETILNKTISKVLTVISILEAIVYSGDRGYLHLSLESPPPDTDGT